MGTNSNMRIGIGYDLHVLAEGRKLFLGGVEIDHQKGALAHSDGDVLLHAICDAVLGALGEEDIGTIFPDTDPVNKDAASSVFLRKVSGLISEKKYKVSNVDCIVILEDPKLGPYKKSIRKRISELMDLPLSSVNVKAKTNEGVGSVGKNEAIASYAVVLLEKE